MYTIYVFKSRNLSDDEISDSKTRNTANLVMNEKVAAIDGEGLNLLGKECNLHCLVQEGVILGIAFNYDDAHKGFRIMAHQQYLDGYHSMYPIEIFSAKSLQIDDAEPYSRLRYILF